MNQLEQQVYSLELKVQELMEIIKINHNRNMLLFKDFELAYIELNNELVLLKTASRT